MLFRFFKPFTVVILQVCLQLVEAPTGLAGEIHPRAESNPESFFVEPHELRISVPVSRRTVNDGFIKIVNKENYDVAVQVDCFLREPDLNGGERRSSTTHLKIEPSEFVLKAGRSKTIAIDYRGEQRISKERTYRIVIKQREESEGANNHRSLGLGFVHVVSFFVHPRSSKEKPRR